LVASSDRALSYELWAMSRARGEPPRLGLTVDVDVEDVVGLVGRERELRDEDGEIRDWRAAGRSSVELPLDEHLPSSWSDVLG
jgi:hypothetical protein